MKRKVFALLMCLVLVMAMPITARADMGPKPSVRIEFTGIEGETYYGTLLSKHDSTGPASAWDGKPEYARSQPGDEGYEIWLNIINYNSGSMTFTFSYVLFEILVFTIEAVAYAVLLKKFSGKEQKKGRAVGYAFVANAASFAFGLWLAHVIPGIF